MRKKKVNNIKEKPILEEVKAEKEQKTREEKQIKWVIGIAIGVILLFIVCYFLFNWYSNRPVSVDYLGIKWYRQGEKDQYSYRGEFSLPYVSSFALFLRNDPRKNNVSLNIREWGFYKKVITSYDADLEKCYEGILAQINLVYFLSGGLKRDITPAMFNKTQAEERNITFADCSSARNQTVIILKKSEYPSIEQDPWNQDCYIINVGECQNLLATEKFILGIIAFVKDQQI